MIVPRNFHHLTHNTSQLLTELILITTIVSACGNGNREKDLPSETLTP